MHSPLFTFCFFADIEALFQALFSVVYTLNDDTKETATIIRNIVRAISSNKENKPRVRLNVLAVLFNIIFAGESKSEVLTGKSIFYPSLLQSYCCTLFSSTLNTNMIIFIFLFLRSYIGILSGHAADQPGRAFLPESR